MKPRTLIFMFVLAFTAESILGADEKRRSRALPPAVLDGLYISAEEFEVFTPTSWGFYQGHAVLKSSWATVSAAVHLPDGATAQDFTCFWFDQTPFRFDAYELELARRELDDTSWSRMAYLSGMTAGTTALGMEPDKDPTIVDAVIDNETYVYGIHGFMSVTDTSNPDLRFYGCHITYIP